MREAQHMLFWRMRYRSETRHLASSLFLLAIVSLGAFVTAPQALAAPPDLVADAPSLDDSLLTSEPIAPGTCSIPSNCCPDWQRYAIFDVLFLQRNNATSGAVIAQQNVGGQVLPLFTTQSLQAATAPGVRLFYGALGPHQVGWEVGYVGLYGMFGAADLASPDNLVVPGAIGAIVPGWSSADEIRATDVASLNMVEFNVFNYCCERECPEDTILWSKCGCEPSCLCTNWLLGFRWAGFTDTAALNVRCCEGDPFTAYTIDAATNMLGPQIGVRTRRQWKNWAVEGWVKAMLAGTLHSANAGPITSSLAPGVIYREPRRLTDSGVGFLGDINYSLVRRLNDTWWLRVGYTLLWLSDVALAPNQWDFTDTPTSGLAPSFAPGPFHSPPSTRHRTAG